MPLIHKPALRQWRVPSERAPSMNEHRTLMGLSAVASTYGVSFSCGLPASCLCTYSSKALRIVVLKLLDPASRRAISLNLLRM